MVVDIGLVVYNVIRSIVGSEIPVYYQGPLPDYGQRMVVYQVLSPSPVAGGDLTWAAAKSRVAFQVFDRDREAANDLAERVCRGIYEYFRANRTVTTTRGEYRLSYVEVEDLPAHVNSNLVNDRSIFRFDFDLFVIVRPQ